MPIEQHFKPWTPGADAILRSLYGTMAPKVIARKMGRTPNAIWSRASRLGLIDRAPEKRQRMADMARRLAWCYGLERASNIIAGIDPEAERDLANWNRGVERDAMRL